LYQIVKALGPCVIYNNKKYKSGAGAGAKALALALALVLALLTWFIFSCVNMGLNHWRRALMKGLWLYLQDI